MATRQMRRARRHPYNCAVEITDGGRRSEAGLSVWQERQKRMLPRVWALLSLLVLYSVLAYLSFSGRLPFWVGVALIPTLCSSLTWPGRLRRTV